MADNPIVPFEELSHTADVAVRVRGRSLPELFEHAALAMFHIIAGDGLDRVPAEREHRLEVASLDLESLLVDWLTELLILFNTTGEMVVRAQILEMDETHLKARVWTGRAPFEPHEDIKAVTYHDLRIEQVNGSWEATIVFDI